jgi:MMP 1-O-methyltransferase
MLDFKQHVAQIGGWLTEKEGRFLYESAKKALPGHNIIEIGSWKGRSTICFGLGAKEGSSAKIYAIDPHTGSPEHIKRFGYVNTYDEFTENIKNAGIDQYIIPVRKTSEEASKEIDSEIDFVLVDGAHEYDFVKKDYELWFPKLRSAGTMAFHDCWHAPGVHFLTAKLLITSSQIRNPRLLDTLTIVEKTDKNSTPDKIQNILFVLYRLLFGWIGSIKMEYFGGAVYK